MRTTRAGEFFDDGANLTRRPTTCAPLLISDPPVSCTFCMSRAVTLCPGLSVSDEIDEVNLTGRTVPGGTTLWAWSPVESEDKNRNTTICFTATLLQTTFLPP